MKILVLGAGLQGCACAFDLVTTAGAHVTLADARPNHVPAFLQSLGGERLDVVQLDARDEAAVGRLMAGHDAALSALPYYFNFDMARLAVEAGVHFADLGGNTEIVRQQQTLGADAEAKGLSIMPDCGLAPGMVNILAVEGIRRLDRVEAVKLYVGGLPQHPKPPLDYTIVYSLEGVLDYYTTPSWIVRDGAPVTVDALSELEAIEFPEPVGRLEAFHTAGGISTMPWEFSGIPAMEYKTLRYPGHAEKVRTIRDLGLLETEPVTVDGASVRPRDLFIAVVDPKLRDPEARDLVALRVVVQGAQGGHARRLTFDLLDFFDADHGISAMMRTTGYSLSITGQMQVDGRVTARGVTTAYDGTPYAPYVEELGRRGIGIKEHAS